MKTITAVEANKEPGAVLEAALLQPVMVQASNGKSVVLLAATEYERLTSMEDAYWAALAAIAEADGFATALETAKLVADADA